MERVESQKPGFRNLAKQAISWISYAKRPLTKLELQHALAVIDGALVVDKENITKTELIVSVCAGLVTVDAESDIIRLVHYTTQEYFERSRDNWFPEALTNITKACVIYSNLLVI
jgi:hypothetical protein